MIAPIVVTYVDGEYRVNDRYGPFIDQLAGAFGQVDLLASESPEGAGPYTVEGRPRYQYSIRSKNVTMKILEYSTMKMDPWRKAWVLLRRVPRIFTSILRADVAYIVMPGYTAYVAAELAHLMRKKYFLYFGSDWDTLTEFMADWGGKSLARRTYTRFSRFAERRAVQHSLFILATGKNLVDRLRASNPNVYATIPMTSIKQENGLTREDTIENGMVSLIFVGSLLERKGVGDLLHALVILKKKGYPLRLNLVGGSDPSYLALLHEIVARESLEDSVNFSGYVSDTVTLIGHYRDADIFVLPTHSEGFPRAIYEAMSQWVPVVASNIDSISAMLRDGEQALLMPAGSPEQLAEGIERVINDGDLRRRLIKNGYQFAQSILTEKTTSDQVLALLDEYIRQE
jgi:glycosyltransferase involved in cell wall biosynthesis